MGGTSERDVDGRDRSKAERQATLSVLISSRDTRCENKSQKGPKLQAQHIFCAFGKAANFALSFCVAQIKYEAQPHLTTSFLHSDADERRASPHPHAGPERPATQIRDEPSRPQKWGHHSQPTASVHHSLVLVASWGWANTTNWRAGATADGTAPLGWPAWGLCSRRHADSHGAPSPPTCNGAVRVLKAKMSLADGPALRPNGPRSGLSAVVARTVRARRVS
jgi:hypothetical protein